MVDFWIRKRVPLDLLVEIEVLLVEKSVEKIHERNLERYCVPVASSAKVATCWS